MCIRDSLHGDQKRIVKAVIMKFWHRGKLEGMDEKDASLEQERRECLEQQEAFYNQAYEGFLKAVSTEMFPMCGMDQTTVDYLLADVYKRQGYSGQQTFRR